METWVEFYLPEVYAIKLLVVGWKNGKKLRSSVNSSKRTNKSSNQYLEFS